jgi:integrase
MSFVDMAYLRKSDIQDNILRYRRRKTGQWLTMAIEPCMQEIIDRYNSSSDYLLPILQDDDSYKNYRSQQRDLNRNISALGRELGFELPLTFYVARHTWATMARDSGAPNQVISAGMGHTSERTTNIYLAQLDHSRIDELNRQVIGLLSGKPKRSKR